MHLGAHVEFSIITVSYRTSVWAGVRGAYKIIGNNKHYAIPYNLKSLLYSMF